MGARFDFDRPATASRLNQAADALRLDAQAYRRATELAAGQYDRAALAHAVDRFLLAFGAMAVLAGVAAFFAYNWDGLHRLAKLAMIETGIVAGVAVTAWRGFDSAAGRVALFAAAFLVGVLFAVFGQSYQTGADPYGLFLVWALLIAGWVVAGRQPGLWMLLLVIVNLAVILYWTQVLRPGGVGTLGGIFGPLLGLAGAVTDSGLATAVFATNAAALALWEIGAARGVAWMRCRWWPRVVALLGLFVVVSGTIFYIFGLGPASTNAWFVVSGPVLFAAFAVVSLWYYQFVRVDLFILAATLVGGIVCITAALAEALGNAAGPEILLLLAVLIIGQTAGAAYWIRRVAGRAHAT